MINMQTIKFEKSSNYLNTQLETQTNNKQLMLDIIANIGFFVKNSTNIEEKNKYEDILLEANNLLQNVMNNIKTIEELNKEIKDITEELSLLLEDQKKSSKTNAFYITAFSNIRNNIILYTKKFQKVENQLEINNNDFNDFININNLKYNFNSISTQENAQGYEFTGFSINEKTDYDTNNSENFVVEENINDEVFNQDDVSNEECNLETIADTDLENIVQEYITDDIENEITEDLTVEDYNNNEIENELTEDLTTDDYDTDEVENETTEDLTVEDYNNDEVENEIPEDNTINQLANEFKALLTELSQGKLPVENSLNMLSTYIDDLKIDLDNSETSNKNTSEEIETPLEENTIPANAEPIEIDEEPLDSISENAEINAVKETISEFIETSKNGTEITDSSADETENTNNINNTSEEVETTKSNETQENKGIFNIQLFKNVSLFKNNTSTSPTFEDIELVETPKLTEDTIYNDNSDEVESINNENEIENLDNIESTTYYDEAIEKNNDEVIENSEISTDNFEYTEPINNQINLDDVDASEIFDNLEDITSFIENTETYEDVNNEENLENTTTEYTEFDNEISNDKIFEDTINDDDLLTKEIDKKIEIISSAELDNETLIISERRKTIYLPYKIPELLHYIESYPNVYSSLQDVVKQEFILPFSYFVKHPYKSRFSESYNIIRNREGKGFIESVSYSVGVAKRHDLNPAIVAACKTQTELDSYLHFLDTNNLKMFNFFNIIYEVNPLDQK